jgi:hypothetical protein
MTDFMTKRVPEGKKGLAKVKHLTITKKDVDFMRLREVVTGGREIPTPAGDYCQLFVGNTLMMSDTTMEKMSNREVVQRSKGHVFIAGLGIGMILVPILAKLEVTKVTVVEKYQDVIDLVAPNFEDPRLDLVQADIFEYTPPAKTKYETIYFDIWPAITGDNLEEMKRLETKFRRFKAKDGWMDSWAKFKCRYR